MAEDFSYIGEPRPRHDAIARMFELSIRSGAGALSLEDEIMCAQLEAILTESPTPTPYPTVEL